MALIVGGAMTACSDDGGDGGKIPAGLKLQKMDIGDAKYLMLSEAAARSRTTDSEVGLFKIDDDGNVSTVVLTCVEEEEGATTSERTDIKVIPRSIHSLSDVYTLMIECQFLMEDGNYINMISYYEPEAAFGYTQFNIIVRNSDGKIFYIPQSANTHFNGLFLDNPPPKPIDDDGDVYFLSQNNLLKITTQNDNLVLKQITPDGIRVEGYDIWPMDNGTIVVPLYENDGYTCLYPNGGFETEGFQNIFIHKTDNGIKAVKWYEIRLYNPSEYIVSLHDFNIGTSVGGNVLSEPIASISSGRSYSTDYGDSNFINWVSKVAANPSGWLNSIYETSKLYLIGNLLLVDKSTKEVTALNWGEEIYPILPNGNNEYKGLTWTTGDIAATWFNPETLESGRVNFNFSAIGDFRTTSHCANIPAGEVMITGIRYSDGKQVFCTANIETGEVFCSVSDSERPVTTLIPLN